MDFARGSGGESVVQIEVQQPLRLIDPHQVQDIFISGLGDIEEAGEGCDRFVLYARQLRNGRETNVIVARVVVPTSALPAILYLAARHIGMTLVRAAKFVSGTVH
jgi:hypothetical protein